jgi:hypothetical protein
LDFSPLILKSLKQATRRSGRGRFVPPDPKVVAQRAAIAIALKAKIAEIEETFKTLTAEEQSQTILKVEHARGIDLTGTGLKPISESGDNF